MDVTVANRLLLLDLDGVVVFEGGPPLLPQLEILRLHGELNPLLRSLDAAVVVLTHRSRAEAGHILRGAGMDPSTLTGILAAEDLLRAGLRQGGVGGLIRWGLRKSWILPVTEQRFGVPRERTAFIDDRIDNLQDLMDHGLGLALHAPSAVGSKHTALVSFDLREAVEHFMAWRDGGLTDRLVSLAPRELAIGNWQRTGLHTRKHGRHLFNMARRIGRMARGPFRR